MNPSRDSENNGHNNTSVQSTGSESKLSLSKMAKFFSPSNFLLSRIHRVFDSPDKSGAQKKWQLWTDAVDEDCSSEGVHENCLPHCAEGLQQTTSTVKSTTEESRATILGDVCVDQPLAWSVQADLPEVDDTDDLIHRPGFKGEAIETPTSPAAIQEEFDSASDSQDEDTQTIDIQKILEILSEEDVLLSLESGLVNKRRDASAGDLKMLHSENRQPAEDISGEPHDNTVSEEQPIELAMREDGTGYEDSSDTQTEVSRNSQCLFCCEDLRVEREAQGSGHNVWCTGEAGNTLHLGEVQDVGNSEMSRDFSPASSDGKDGTRPIQGLQFESNHEQGRSLMCTSMADTGPGYYHHIAQNTHRRGDSACRECSTQGETEREQMFSVSTHHNVLVMHMSEEESVGDVSQTASVCSNATRCMSGSRGTPDTVTDSSREEVQMSCDHLFIANDKGNGKLKNTSVEYANVPNYQLHVSADTSDSCNVLKDFNITVSPNSRNDGIESVTHCRNNNHDPDPCSSHRVGDITGDMSTEKDIRQTVEGGEIPSVFNQVSADNDKQSIHLPEEKRKAVSPVVSSSADSYATEAKPVRMNSRGFTTVADSTRTPESVSLKLVSHDGDSGTVDQAPKVVIINEAMCAGKETVYDTSSRLPNGALKKGCLTCYGGSSSDPGCVQSCGESDGTCVTTDVVAGVQLESLEDPDPSDWNSTTAGELPFLHSSTNGHCIEKDPEHHLTDGENTAVFMPFNYNVGCINSKRHLMGKFNNHAINKTWSTFDSIQRPMVSTKRRHTVVTGEKSTRKIPRIRILEWLVEIEEQQNMEQRIPTLEENGRRGDLSGTRKELFEQCNVDKNFSSMTKDLERHETTYSGMSCQTDPCSVHGDHHHQEPDIEVINEVSLNEEETANHREDCIPFTPAEESAIRQYLKQRDRYLYVRRGNMWRLMEKRRIVPGRSWRSLAKHYLKHMLAKSLKKQVHGSRCPGMPLNKEDNI